MKRVVVACVLLIGLGVSAAIVLWLRGRGEGILPVIAPAPDFELTGSNGQPVRLADLQDRVWVVDFVFTRCSSICPRMHSRMWELQEKLPPEARVVSISVDPDYDTPEVMARYARMINAKPGRWLWLTGGKAAIYELMQTGFKVGKPLEPTGTDIPHSEHMVLVDGRGRIRGYYAALDRKVFEKLLAEARSLQESETALRPLRVLPAVNAGLNSCSFVLLSAGLFFIKRKRVTAHRACMVAACVVSLAFLVSYLTYHHYFGSTAFQGTGWIRPVYFAILISHTVLAGLIVPMVLITLWQAIGGRFERHRAIARWTLPAWMYVSITGVVVYAMLYH